MQGTPHPGGSVWKHAHGICVALTHGSAAELITMRAVTPSRSVIACLRECGTPGTEAAVGWQATRQSTSCGA